MRRTIQMLAILGSIPLAATGVVAVSAGVASGTDSSDAAPGKSVTWKIKNAMSGGPRAIAKDATILDWPKKAGGAFLTLRQGDPQWTCVPDYPDSPGNDPWCYDRPTAAWLDAWMTGKKPKLSTPGLSYMLQGGSDASNTDPAATEPAPGEHWMHIPPHIMVMPTQKLDPATYSTDHKSGGPFVMWGGTPYEHYMIPVK